MYSPTYFLNTVVSRDMVFCGYEYFGLPAESGRNVCSEIPRKVRDKNEPFFEVRVYFLRFSEYFFILLLYSI